MRIIIKKQYLFILFAIIVFAMNFIPFRYIISLLPAASVAISFQSQGIMTWFAVFFVFGIIPVLELILNHGGKFGQDDQSDNAVNNNWYNIVIYSVIPVHLFFVYWYVIDAHSSINHSAIEFFGKAFAMGIMCGTYGINVAHELGHRQNIFEQFLAKMLLLTSCYMHFFIEHNRGHHKYVGTSEDPSTGRYNEPVYSFWFRSMFFVWISAWKLEFERLKRLNLPKFHPSNQMLQFQLIQLVFLGGIFYFEGLESAISMAFAAFIGALLLETINYIEHYGLVRNKTKDGLYEIVTEKHSWNSNHIVGRLLLFELSRHSDHHAKSTKKFQELKSIENAPQMPTGYPGMMVLSLIYPLWLKVMNPLVKKYQSNNF